MEEGALSARENLRQQDRWLLAAAICLMSIGLVSIFTAASGFSGRGMVYVARQSLAIAVSLIVLFVVVAIGYERIFKHAYVYYAITVFLLLLTVFAAPRTAGSRRWLTIGTWGIQASEFAKVTLALAMSKYLSRNPIETLGSYLGALLVAAPTIILVLIQPDLGSSIVLLAIVFIAIFISGAPQKYLWGTALTFLAALPTAWFFMKEYQRNRILVFLDPAMDPLGAGYNVIQSRIAVGSGGFWGKGFLEGMQSKLRFLPEAHTDFIFSVYSEEFGFIGALVVLFLFFFLFSRILQAGLKSRDVRAKILVGCVSAWIWFQMFESIGMSMGLMPVTGLTLPLFSYGGSSLLSILIALGIVSSVHSSNVKIYELS